MKRKQLPSLVLPMPRGFDHERSELVDVVTNEQGEFVQVWDHPRGVAHRRLLLTYQRTVSGPVDISSRIYPPEGVWQVIETTGPHRTFYYRAHRDFPRHEEALPIGGWLVDDHRAGLVIRRSYPEHFNWDTSRPGGRSLGNLAIMERQSAGLAWFSCSYQETWAEEALVSSDLRLVEEYLGKEPVRIREYPSSTGA